MKSMNTAIINTLKSQAKAEAPRLLLATLALLIVGLLFNPSERKIQNTQEVVMEIPLKKKSAADVSVANLKNPGQR